MLAILKHVILGLLLAVVAVACESEREQPTDVIRVGTIVGPETQLMEVAKRVAARRYKLMIEIVPFQDYATPNVAVADGMIEANAFQTAQYLEAAIATQSLDLVSVGNSFIYPMGMYSKKIAHLTDLPPGATVALPNDPSNEQRALRLAEQAGLIKLTVTTQPISVADISENPLQLQFISLDAAQLPRALDDVDLAAINTNYAVAANLLPSRDALVVEGTDSPYVNTLVTRKELVNDPRIRHWVAAYQSPEVLAEAEVLFKGQAVAAFTVQADNRR